MDQLDQHHRRSNLIIKYIFLLEKERNEDVPTKVTNIISDDMNLPDVISEIDKLHRVGMVNKPRI